METILITASLYFISIIIYNNFSFFKKFLIQPSILSGLLFLFLGSQGVSILSNEIYNDLKILPSMLISFLFSGIILSNPAVDLKNSRFYFRVLRQGVFVWIIAILQLLMGFIISYFYFGKDSPYLILSSLIEIGWIGGHGSAAAYSGFVKQLGVPEAGDLAIISATIGLLWGNISGIILVNFLKRKELKKKSILN